MNKIIKYGEVTGYKIGEIMMVHKLDADPFNWYLSFLKGKGEQYIKLIKYGAKEHQIKDAIIKLFDSKEEYKGMLEYFINYKSKEDYVIK